MSAQHAWIIGPAKPREQVKLTFLNRGLKGTGGQLPKAYLYIDCRGLPDAATEGPGGSGDSVQVQDYMKLNAPESLDAMVQIIDGAVNRIPQRRRGETDPYARPIEICCFCAFGMHRSRAAKHILAQRCKELGYQVEVEWLGTTKVSGPSVSMALGDS